MLGEIELGRGDLGEGASSLGEGGGGKLRPKSPTACSEGNEGVETGDEP